MFILYTSALGEFQYNNRLIYALNKNGTNSFPNTPGIEYKINETSVNRGFPRIIFLNLEKNNKQYLLSTSLFFPTSSITELYEIGKNDVSENEITTSFSDTTENVLGLNNHITSYHYSLIKLPNENKYFFIFAQGGTIKIIKFEFKNPTLNRNDLHIIKEIKATSNNYITLIISSFLIEEEHILVLFHVNRNNSYSRIYYDSDNDNLVPINEEFGSKDVDPVHDYLFFKGVYLKNKYCAILYSTGYFGNCQIKLNISNLKIDEETGNYSFETQKQEFLESRYMVNIHYITNEFITINK